MDTPPTISVQYVDSRPVQTTETRYAQQGER